MYSHILLALVPAFILPIRCEPLPFKSSGLIAKNTDCRCFPGDICWPSLEQWNRFNETVKGKLVATVPLAAPCHGVAYEPSECKTIKDQWFNPNTHIESSSSIMAPFFTNNSCNPFLPKEAPCVVGAYVQYSVAAENALDYQATIKFVQEHNIRLVIRNTGHDWLGRSSGAGAVAIWTHRMKKIDIIDYKSSHYTGKALKVGAGVQLEDAYKAAQDARLIVVGGTCPSVGLAGGYTQGGGHGLTVSKFGLAADQALEWEVVTADQKIIRATPIENQDLYWALSGGGAGTYGVVLSLTIKAYQDEQTSAANLTFSNAGISQDAFYTAIQRYILGIPAILDAGATTTWLNSNDTFTLSPTVGVGMTKEQIDKLHNPILEDLDQLGISYSEYLVKLHSSVNNTLYSLSLCRVSNISRYV